MLAASVLTAVMGTGSVFAAEVQAGYTPDMKCKLLLQILQQLTIRLQKAAVYNAGKRKKVLIHKMILMRLF